MDLEWEEKIHPFYVWTFREILEIWDLNRCFSQCLSFLTQGIMQHLLFASAMKGRKRRRPDLCPMVNRDYCKKARIRIMWGRGEREHQSEWGLTLGLVLSSFPKIKSNCLCQNCWHCRPPIYLVTLHTMLPVPENSWNRNTISKHCSVHYQSDWE